MPDTGPWTIRNIKIRLQFGQDDSSVRVSLRYHCAP